MSSFGGLWGCPSYATPGGAGTLYVNCGAAVNTLLFRGDPAVTPASNVPSVLFLRDYGLCLSTLIIDTTSGLIVDSENPMIPTLLAAGTVVKDAATSLSARTQGGATIVTGAAYTCGPSMSTTWIPTSAISNLVSLSNTMPVRPTSYSKCAIPGSSYGDMYFASCDPGSTITSINSACYICDSSTVCPASGSCTNGVSLLTSACLNKNSCTAYWTGGDTCPGSGKGWVVDATCSATVSSVVSSLSMTLAGLSSPS